MRSVFVIATVLYIVFFTGTLAQGVDAESVITYALMLVVWFAAYAGLWRACTR